MISLLLVPANFYIENMIRLLREHHLGTIHLCYYYSSLYFSWNYLNYGFYPMQLNLLPSEVSTELC